MILNSSILLCTLTLICCALEEWCSPYVCFWRHGDLPSWGHVSPGCARSVLSLAYLPWLTIETTSQSPWFSRLSLPHTCPVRTPGKCHDLCSPLLSARSKVFWRKSQWRMLGPTRNVGHLASAGSSAMLCRPCVCPKSALYPIVFRDAHFSIPSQPLNILRKTSLLWASLESGL